MKQQIILSGTGGQGIIFITRLLAEAAMEEGLDILTSETHGMAMRGGTVISYVKAGPFKSPMIHTKQGDMGLFLASSNLAIHKKFIKADGLLFVNTNTPGEYMNIDATSIAKEGGSLLVTNLVLLGYAVGTGKLFCSAGTIQSIIEKISPPRHLDMNMKGFELGLNYMGGKK